MKKLLLLTALVFVFCVSNASAIPLFTEQQNQLSDNSAEYLINADGTTADPGIDTIVDVGDRLRGWFDIGTIEDLTGGGGTRNLADYPFEVTGFFDVVVTAKDSTFGTFTLSPYAGFATEIEGLAALAPGSAAGSMVAFFQDPAEDYSRLFTASVPPPDDLLDDSEEGLLATASGGSLLWTFGDSVTGVGESWTVSTNIALLNILGFAFDDIAGFKSVSTATAAGNANMFLNNIVNNTSFEFNKQPAGLNFFDAIGTGSLLGVQGADTPADTWDDFNFTIHATAIPEPTTMMLFGIGLLGIAGTTRKNALK